MLIVVVIIGILAAALIPRLQTVQARARDTKRKADVTQIGSSLAVYGSDNGSFVALSGLSNSSNSGLRTFLVANANYLTEMPIDLNQSSWYLWTVGSGLAGTATTINWGFYGFTTLNRNSLQAAAVIVVARTETDGSLSNWVTFSGSTTAGTWLTAHSWAVIKYYDADAYERNCVTVSYSWATQVIPASPCFANRNSPDLRYIYIY